jgi:hypothetical protein
VGFVLSAASQMASNKAQKILTFLKLVFCCKLQRTAFSFMKHSALAEDTAFVILRFMDWCTEDTTTETSLCNSLLLRSTLVSPQLIAALVII